MKARDSKGRFIKHNLPTSDDKPTSSAEQAKKKRTSKPKKVVVQRHHITYLDGRYHPPKEWVVPVMKGEHRVITRLQWLKTLSPGARAAITYLLATMPERVLPVK